MLGAENTNAEPHDIYCATKLMSHDSVHLIYANNLAYLRVNVFTQAQFCNELFCN